MIIFYYDPRNSSSKKAIRWFNNMGIDISIKKLQYITKQDLLHILILSNSGLSDILKSEVKSGTQVSRMRRDINNMQFNDSVDFILKHTELLKAPIILDDSKLMIGFNMETIRQFIPRAYRKLQ